MRKLTGHKALGAVHPNDKLEIFTDSPAPANGQACKAMLFSWTEADGVAREITLPFQFGTYEEVGTNGVTIEALLVAVIDRLRCFQGGPFACRENAIALTKAEEALMWLHQRTASRVARGVEGKHER